MHILKMCTVNVTTTFWYKQTIQNTKRRKHRIFIFAFCNMFYCDIEPIFVYLFRGHCDQYKGYFNAFCPLLKRGRQFSHR